MSFGGIALENWMMMAYAIKDKKRIKNLEQQLKESCSTLFIK